MVCFRFTASVPSARQTSQLAASNDLIRLAADMPLSVKCCLQGQTNARTFDAARLLYCCVQFHLQLNSASAQQDP